LLLDSYLKSRGWTYKEQISSGRLFLTSDFEPAHLRTIYVNFQNNIVDEYLNGKLGSKLSNIFSALRNS
jgi:hypothetical protein